MVREQERTLDRRRHWHHNLCPDRLHHQPVPLRLYPDVIPTIRCFALRRQ